MSTDNQSVTENELLAFVDGELELARRDAVTAYLAENPEKAAEVSAWQEQNKAIRALYAPIASEAVPPGLTAHAIDRNLRYRRTSVWRLAAAAVVLLTIGAGLGYGLRDQFSTSPPPTDRLISAAVDAHELFVIQRRHPVEIAAPESAHMTTWLSNSLRRPLVAPDLTELGYALVGGRLLPGNTGPAAQIMYETADGERITLYITPRRSGDQSADKLIVANGLSALYWATDAITCTIVGGVQRDTLQKIAAKVFPALSRAESSLDTNYRRG